MATKRGKHTRNGMCRLLVLVGRRVCDRGDRRERPTQDRSEDKARGATGTRTRRDRDTDEARQGRDPDMGRARVAPRTWIALLIYISNGTREGHWEEMHVQKYVRF